MRFLLFILFLFPSICFAGNDSETTIGGYTASAHLIQASGQTLTPAPYLNFVGATGDTVAGVTNIFTGSGGGGGGSSQWTGTSPGPIYYQTGNVGIGTGATSPNDNLQVNGTSGGITINGVGTTNGIDSYTKLMLHLDNNVTDSETSPKTVTNNGPITFSNSIIKSGFGYSGYFPNSTSYFLSVPNSSDFNFSGDFTVDFLWYPITLSSTIAVIGNADNASGTSGWSIFYSGTTLYAEAMYSAGSWAMSIGAASTLNLNAWNHVALVRHGSTVNLYVNGSSIASGTYSGSITTTNNLIIGKNEGTSAYPVNGYLDEVRISNGIARWTSNFTPPTSPYSGTTTMPSLTLSSNGTTVSQISNSSTTGNLNLINNGNSAITVNSVGNVGIGSINPGVSLDVNGTVRMTGFNLSTSPTNNYVLTSDANGNGTWQAGGTIGGSITAQQVAYGSGTNTITGSSNLTYDDGMGDLSVLEVISSLFNYDGSQATYIGNPAGITLGGNTVVNVGQTFQAGGWVFDGADDLNDTAGTIESGDFSTSGFSVNFAGNGYFAGNVGIGSASPGQKLDVKGNVRATAFIGNGAQLTGLGAAAGWTTTNTNDVYETNGGNVGIGTTITNGGAALSVMNGNVGIGTWMPAALFDVHGTAYFGIPGGSNTNRASISDDVNNASYFSVNGGVNGLVVNGNGSVSLVGGGNNVTVNTGSSASAAVTFQTNGVTRMKIDSSTNSGNVGIGSLTPGQALDVQGTIRDLNGQILATASTASTSTTTGSIIDSGGLGVSGSTFMGTATNALCGGTTPILCSGSTGNNGLVILNSSTPSSTSGGGIIAISNNNVNGIVTGNRLGFYLFSGYNTASVGNAAGIQGWGEGTWSSSSQPSYLTFETTPVNSTTRVQAMEIDSTGNVGIGSVHPGQALDVQGTIRGLSGGSCTTLYQCVGGVDAGVIQTSACTLCPASTCTAMNGCF